MKNVQPSLLVRSLRLCDWSGLQGCDADAVSLPTGSICAQFRDAVHQKNVAILTGIVSSQLIIYKNMAAFENRNDALSQEHELLLKSSSPLDAFGTTEQQALIVVVPPSSSSSTTDVALAIRELNQTNLLLLEGINESTKFMKRTAKNEFSLLKPNSYKTDNDDVRLQWLIHYGIVPAGTAALPQTAYCHVLGQHVPLRYLTCSHIFRKRWHRHVREFGLSHINSGKNILMMLKIFEQAFDAGRFVLLVDKKQSSIRIKILDDELKTKNLDQAMKDIYEPNYKPGDVDFKRMTCFGDLDGKTLSFLNTERPYTRCLSFHALVAREHAIDYGWIDESVLKELDDDDMWSDGYLDEKTKKIIEDWRVEVGSQQMSD